MARLSLSCLRLLEGYRNLARFDRADDERRLRGEPDRLVLMLQDELVAFDQRVLKVHVLDKSRDFMAELEMVEQNVARLFGPSLKFSKEDK